MFFNFKESSNYNNFLLTSRVLSSGHRIANLLQTTNSSASSNTGASSEENNRNFTFSFTPPGSTHSIKLTIKELTTLDPNTIQHCIKEFGDIANFCAWDDTGALVSLKLPIHHDFRKHIRQKQSVDTALDALLQIIFPRHKRAFYNKELLNITQEKCNCIKDYVKAIDKTLFALSTASGYTKTINEERRKDAFFRGLTDNTRIKMQRLGLHELEEIYTKIADVKESILENA